MKNMKNMHACLHEWKRLTLEGEQVFKVTIIMLTYYLILLI